MDPGRWRRINDIFQDTIACASDRRQAFLVEVCADDAGLRAEVERLVRAHEHASGFLARPALANAHHWLSFGERSALAVPPDGAVHDDAEFRGTPRFSVLRRIGAGGMGVVYAVHDGVRDEVIALKTLRRARPADVSRLKREFRSLADLAHPNILCLYELVVEADHCFFTMELVDGLGLLAYLRRPVAGAGRSGAEGLRVDPGILRSVLRQLTAGLSALHAHGKLHRDIKPSNIMVRPDGRVVILDFGLMSDALPGRAAEDDRMAGTPAYLAPEQHAGAAPSEASDWYAVGVTLYEALTGGLPFEGSWDALGSRKNHSDPPPPVWIDPEVPDDLNEICMGWLCRNPERRLSGRDALDRLDDVTPPDGIPPHAQTPRREARRLKPVFIGRARQLATLSASFAAIREGGAAAVCIHGPSGIGKTALVQQFLEQLPHGDETVVLRGRCYQHESVSYEALDGIIDSLSSYLRALPPAQAAALLPTVPGALARAFPALLQVEAIARAPGPKAENPDPSAQRRLAFSSLRELLARLAQRHSVVLYIDDLHWADVDSMLLLEVLLRPPDPPPLLMLTCLRTEEIAAKPFLQGFLQGQGWPFQTTLSLEPLTEDETQDVVASLIPSAAGITPAEQLELSREAGGNPFLLEQLALYAAVHVTRDGGDATLAHLLQDRLSSSPAGTRRFLEVLALCGRPMPPQVVYEAAGLAGDERPLIALLHADRLLRHSGSASHIEMYHDRLRETLAAQLSTDEARGIHGLLVRALISHGAADPEALFEHCQGAGDRDGASRQAAQAAAKAQAVLAFDRASFFYRSALELMPHALEASDWTQGLAESLTNAGRPREAADVYLAASVGAQRWRQVELQRRAAEQFLIGGHIDQGMDVIRTVLGAFQMRLAPSPLVALAALLWRRARIRWRGLAFVERDADQMSAESLLRIDTCWSVTTGLAMVDSIRAAEFNTRHLLLALNAGDPYRIARALVIEASFLATSRAGLQHAAVYAGQAAFLAKASGRPHAEALSTLADGISAFMIGEWKKASALCGRSQTILREQCPGATWETNVTENFLLGALLFQGEIGEVSRRLPPLLTAAQDRGNRYFETELRTRMNVVWLAADQPDEGERHANEVMAGWSHQGFHRQHYSHVLAGIQTELYRGAAEAAWHLVADHWPAIERTLLLRVQLLRIEALFLRARAALLNAARGRDVERFLSIARVDARRIRRCGMRWSDAIAMLVTATVTHLQHRPGAAQEMMAAAVSAFERVDMPFHAAVARRRLGAMHDDERGRALIHAADAWMTAQGIRNPARMAGLIAPGFADHENV